MKDENKNITSERPSTNSCGIGLPYITVIVPVRNEERHISSTLTMILEQDYPLERFEVIVADGMSEDKTSEVVKMLAVRYSNLREVKNSKRLASAGRNAGFMNGRGDIFLVIDGHCHIKSNQLLMDLVKCFEKSGAQCLGRPQPLDPPGLSIFQKAVAMARASRLGHSKNSLIYDEYEGYASPVSNGAAYKKEVFEKIGLIDESFDACEDVEFNYRVEKAGFKAYTSPRLTVRYYPRESIRGLFKQMMRYGKGRARFIKKHPEAFSMETMIPPVFVLGLSGVVALGILSSWSFGLKGAAKITALPYLLYSAVVLVESFRISIKSDIKYALYLPAIFFTIHTGLGLGFLRGVFERRANL